MRWGFSEALAQDMARNETLYIGGWQWGPPPTCNPLNPNHPWPVASPEMNVFEALFAYNMLTGDLDPLLGKELPWPDAQTAVVTLQDGTHWSDGTPLTSADVVYTLTLPQRAEGLYFSDITDYVTSIEATDDKTITFKLNPEKINPGLVKHHLANDHIMPQHIWEPLEAGPDALIDVIDMKPVASGPYQILDASAERMAAVRDDNYWGASVYGTPSAKYLVHPIFDGNDSSNLAFSKGDLDLSQNFIPEVWKIWEDDKQPAGTWFKDAPYHAPGSIPLLFINVNKAPLDNPKVRLALAYSIDYAQIAATAMSKYSVNANASLIIPDGGEKQFFPADDVAASGWTYDPEKAKAILEGELGAKKDGSVYVLGDGTRLGPFVAHCPFGWTDWQTAITLLAQSASDIGFDITTDFPDAPVVTAANQAGDFDLALWYVSGVSAAGPWRRMRDVLDNRGVPALGEPAFWNYNRYKNDAVGPLLDQAALADAAGQVDLYKQLDAIFRADVPAIPLMYRPDEFYEFNANTWTGFPTSDNPVGPPMQRNAGIKLFFNLKNVTA